MGGENGGQESGRAAQAAGAAAGAGAAAAEATAAAQPGEESSDWQEITDPASGKPYYFNKVTEESMWENPDTSLLLQLGNVAKAERKR
jgi:hypothetical protein